MPRSASVLSQTHCQQRSGSVALFYTSACRKTRAIMKLREMPREVLLMNVLNKSAAVVLNF